MSDSPMLLADVRSLYTTHRRMVRQSANLLGYTIKWFGNFLGHVPTIADLTDDIVSAWLSDLESRGGSAWTVNGNRTRLLCMWRFAAKRKLCSPPEDVRRCPPPEPLPIAWTLEQVGRLLKACDRMTGKTMGVPVGDKLRANILAAYDTGLRRSDLWRLHRDQIRPDGTVFLRQHKTGRRHCPRLRPDTLAAVLALPGEYPLRWGDWLKNNCGNYCREFGKLRRLAGLPDHGALHQLRRTGATFVAKEHGMEAARRFLGHRSPEMVRHYVDESIALQETYLPPALGKERSEL